MYLKGTVYLNLMYRGESDEIEGFSDVSFADCKGSLTTSGYLIRLFGDSVSWRTASLRSIVYLSSGVCVDE